MNIEMKGVMNKYILILSIAIAAFLPSNIYGTHIVGGDMSFECLGNDFYEITLTLRRDCIHGAEDAPFDEQAAVGIFDGTGRKLDFLGRLGILYMPFEGQDEVRNNVPNCALEGDSICVQHAVYKAQIFLPFREQGYVLTYQRCCRNETLDNIIDPIEAGATRFVCLTKETLRSCNSGPVFGAFPDVIACTGDDISFDGSATDSNGDSLAYKLYTPHVGAAIDYPKPQPPWNPPYQERIEYADGFSEDNMLGSGTPLAIDVNTGLITGNPSEVGQYLAGILVEEWRDGEKLSETKRGFEYNVRVCGDFPVVDFTVEDNCAGLTINVTNNTTGAVSYAWNFNYPSTDAEFQSIVESPGTFTYTEPGIYNVRLEVVDAEGICTLDLIKEVIAFNSQLTSSFTASNGCCFEDKTELSLEATSVEPSADYSIATYEWEVTLNGEMPFSMNGQNVNFSVSCSDDIMVTLLTTSTTGCMATVTEAYQVEMDFGSQPGNICDEVIVICIGETATVGPLNENRTYTWTPSDADLIDLTDPFNPIFTPSDTTIYTVVATDEFGAESTGTVTVNVVGSFDLTIDDQEDLECLAEATFNASANRNDLTYEWSKNTDFDSIYSTTNPGTVPLEPGTNNIYVRATSPEGCQEVALVIVESVAITIDVTPGEYNACIEESTTVTVQTTDPERPITIKWDESDNIISTDLGLFTIEVAAVGDEELFALTYTVSNSDGCSNTGSVDVTITRSISATITGDFISCTGEFSLLGTSSGMNPTFEWSLNSDFSEIIGTDASLQLSLEENATVYLRSFAGIGCTSEIVSQDLSLGAFTVDFGSLPDDICFGDRLVIEGTSDDPTVVIVYGPSDNILEVLSSTSIAITALEGQTSVTIPYVATNEPECEFTGELTFNVGTVEPPVVAINVDCSTGTVTFTTDQEDGSVSWDFGDTSTSDDVSTLGSPSYPYPGQGTYTVVLTDISLTCNFDPVTIDVVVPELFSLTTPNDSIVKYCDNDPVNLSVMTTGDVTVTWEDGDGNVLATGNELSFNPNGEVDLVRAIAVSTDPACGEAALEFILEQYIFDLTIGDIPAVICPNDEFNLSIIDNTNSELIYEWLPPSAVVSGGNTANPTLSLGSDADIVVRVTNEVFGCSTEIIIPIDLPNVDLTVGADPDPNIFLCDEVIIFAEPDGYSSYEWSNGVSGATQSVAPTETTTYTVTITDINGCTNTGSVTINVEIPPCNSEGIFIPTAFSPNGDGSNDLLLVRSNAVKEMDFFIIDRWGDEVFRTTNQRVGWNGQFKNDGKELSPDVYAWCLIATCSNGDDIHLVGNVSLLR